jgi:predicted transcriptional regulator
MTTPVKDVMTTNLVVFKEDTPVDDVATTLARRHLTGAPVVTEDGRVVGVVSELDVFSKDGRVARDIMSTGVISISEDTPIDDAAALFAGQRIRRLPVLRAGRLVGLLSRSDVLDFFVQSRWVCLDCGHAVHGLRPPRSCRDCSGSRFSLERAQPST